MSSLEGDAKDGLFNKDSDSDISIEDRMELLQQARNYAYHAKAASYLVSPTRPSESSSNALEPNLIRRSASYILTRSDHLESNVDNWMANEELEEARRLRRNATVVRQQPNLAENHGALASFWYMLALLPLVNLHRQGWCSPRNSIIIVLNTVDLFAAWLKQMVSYLRTQISRVDIDQVLQDCFVVGMDTILALQTFAFILLSYYQTSL
ncbi:uncharacterized protein LOC133515780 [Cydia pomonella]|uniref:uncharacterized protein LOC133515780 n=1 Tax=Cydia pomonella TaxID=82600 RepID=UPI002ADE1949|nr:uncharacterized protein LOC133515780 [Cydia pomonella]